MQGGHDGVDTTVTERRSRRAERSDRARTCVGCGLRDDPSSMARLSVVRGEVRFGALLGGRVRPAFGGRGAHLHARPVCLAKAPRSLARALRAEVRVDPAELGSRLFWACDEAITGRVLAGRRAGALALGVDVQAPLVIVAVDGYPEAAGDALLASVIAGGRAIAWKTKSELGTLLGEGRVASCSIRDAVIASQVIRLRAAADAGMAAVKATGKGAECSRCPEAR
jgi:hypothetical protein